MEKLERRGYQIEVEEKAYKKYDEGVKRLLMLVPGGGGKTIISASMAMKEISIGNPVLFVAHRRELINQCREKWAKYGLQSGIIMGAQKTNYNLLAQVGSIQTISKRHISESSLIIIDECHRATAPTYKEHLFNKFPRSRFLGLTGTPFGTKSKPLGDVFEDYIESVKSSTLISLGYTVPEIEKLPGGIVSKSFKIKSGEFDEQDVMRAFDRSDVYKNLIKAYKDHADGLKTIVFCCNIDHSIKTAQAFTDSGYRAAHIDGKTPSALRDAIVKAFASGEIQILCNYGIACEGLDVPDTEAVILNLATRSATKYFQACWRGARPMPSKGKTHYILIDMADNFMRFGSPSQDIECDLYEDYVEKIESIQRESPKKTCKNCQRMVHASLSKCSHCGCEFIKTPEEIKEEEFISLSIKEKKHLSWKRLKISDVWKVKDEELEEFAEVRGFKSYWLLKERENRKKGYKNVVIKNYRKDNLHDMQRALQRMYFEKKIIDAKIWQFIEENEHQVIFNYKG